MNKIGQINRGSNFGELIYNFTLQPDIKNIVEIGTWNGCGSTRCIRDGVLDKKTPCNVISIEASLPMYLEAVQNNQPLPDNFKILHGKIIDLEDLNWLKYNELSSEEKGWLEEDIKNYKQCPDVFNEIPSKIDLLVLDGGEFSSNAEFHKLSYRSKIIVLDDTKTRKFKEIRDLILYETRQYHVYYDVQDDRNGYMIVENRHFK